MKLLKKTIALFIIIICVMTLISPLIAQAKEIEMLDPNGIRTVTTDKEKRVLLGGLTADEAREEYLLGIASKFAVFVEDTFTHRYSDVGGKAAVGRKFSSLSSWNQVGCEYYNYQLTTHDGSADVVLGSENFRVTSERWYVWGRCGALVGDKGRKNV